MLNVRTTADFKTHDMIVCAHLIHLNRIAVALAEGANRPPVKRLLCWVQRILHRVIFGYPAVDKRFSFRNLFWCHLSVQVEVKPQSLVTCFADMCKPASANRHNEQSQSSIRDQSCCPLEPGRGRCRETVDQPKKMSCSV